MFQVGDAVIHPDRGAGVVIDIKELERRGGQKQYYSIRLLGQKRTSLMIPVSSAESMGLRAPISPSKLEQIWNVLVEEPETFPDNYRKRHRLIREKLQEGEITQVAEVLRDLTWWKHTKGDGLTRREKRFFRYGMKLLAGEVAGSQGIDMEKARKRIRSLLQARLSAEEELLEEEEEEEARVRLASLMSKIRQGVSAYQQTEKETD